MVLEVVAVHYCTMGAAGPREWGLQSWPFSTGKICKTLRVISTVPMQYSTRKEPASWML